MKKFFIIMAVMFLAVFSASAQAKVFEGYDNVKWGTTVEELKRRYPDVKEVTDDNHKKCNQRAYMREGKSSYKVYTFFENKLYMGATYYERTDNETISKLESGLASEYGEFTETSRNNYGYLLSKEISPTLAVDFKVKYGFNGIGVIVLRNAGITYTNTVMKAKAEQFKLAKFNDDGGL